MCIRDSPCVLSPGTRAEAAYGMREISERHRHRYEVNNHYVPRLEAAGLIVSAKTKSEDLTEIAELAGHPWFIGVQFHPEFTSTPRDGHPLFSAFIRTAVHYRESGNHIAREPAKLKSIA